MMRVGDVFWHKGRYVTVHRISPQGILLDRLDRAERFKKPWVNICWFEGTRFCWAWEPMTHLIMDWLNTNMKEWNDEGKGLSLTLKLSDPDSIERYVLKLESLTKEQRQEYATENGFGGGYNPWGNEIIDNVICALRDELKRQREAQAVVEQYQLQVAQMEAKAKINSLKINQEEIRPVEIERFSSFDGQEVCKKKVVSSFNV